MVADLEKQGRLHGSIKMY